MITQETSIEKQIKFYTERIDYYLEAVKNNPKGKRCRLWLEWITKWNENIIEMQETLLKDNQIK